MFNARSFLEERDVGLVALVMAVRCRRWGADGFVEALRERGLVVCEL